MKDTNYLSIQKELLTNLYRKNPQKMCCYGIHNHDLYIGNGFYMVRIPEDKLYLDIKRYREPVSLNYYFDHVFYDYDYQRVYSAMPCSYKNEKLFRLHAGDNFTTYVNRQYYNLFAEDIPVFITNDYKQPILFMREEGSVYTDVEGFIFPVHINVEGELKFYAEE